jgi:hypothetical protein
MKKVSRYSAKFQRAHLQATKGSLITARVIPGEGFSVPILRSTPINQSKPRTLTHMKMKAVKIICGIAVGLMCALAATVKAQYIYVANYGNGAIGEYGSDGSTINAALISAGYLSGVAISGTNLFVSHALYSTVSEYTTSGTIVNDVLVDGGRPGNMVISGDYLFIVNIDNVGVFTTSGTILNSSLITGLDGPYGIAISGNNLFVANETGGTVGEYSFGGAIAASLISGLNKPCGVAVSGTNLFVASYGSGTVGEYTTSGATNNASLISGLNKPEAIAIFGTNLFVVNSGSGTVGEYTTSGVTVNASLISGLDEPDAIVIVPPVPQLNIAAVGNQSILYYPYSVSGTNYTLQNVPSLSSTNWSTVTNGVPIVGLLITNNLPSDFFRLEP